MSPLEGVVVSLEWVKTQLPNVLVLKRRKLHLPERVRSPPTASILKQDFQGQKGSSLLSKAVGKFKRVRTIEGPANLCVSHRRSKEMRLTFRHLDEA